MRKMSEAEKTFVPDDWPSRHPRIENALLEVQGVVYLVFDVVDDDFRHVENLTVGRWAFARRADRLDSSQTARIDLGQLDLQRVDQ